MGALEMIAHACAACDRARMSCNGCQGKAKGAAKGARQQLEIVHEEVADLRDMVRASSRAWHANARSLSVRMFVTELVVGAAVALVVFRVVRELA